VIIGINALLSLLKLNQIKYENKKFKIRGGV
jgi:hypothetical protein